MKDEGQLLQSNIISILEKTDEPIKVCEQIISNQKTEKMTLASFNKQVKALRKLVLDDKKDDKQSKKLFKKSIQSLEKENTLTLDKDGTCKLVKKRKSEESSPKEKKKRKKDKKQREEAPARTTEENDSPSPKPKTPLKTFTNPQGITRLFIGNLPFAVDEVSLKEHLLGAMTHVKWITDKETGKFYGSAFVEIRSAAESSSIVNTLNGETLMNRPLKIAYAPARPGDIWPPGKEEPNQSKTKVHTMSEKPEGCVKLFIGNLSYDIDDEGISKFFANVGAEMKAVRWLSHRDTGDFKGCGYIEFYSEDACTKAASLNGKHLLGRPIRIDWDAGF